MAVLLQEFPERAEFFPQNIPRGLLLEHVRRTLRRLCLTSNCCTDPRAVKPGTWGGRDPKGDWHWQAGLETEHWTLAAHLLTEELDDDTKSLVRQVATAEADGAMQREIPSAKKGNTAADDCSWNAGILGVCAAIYADDARAAQWDEAAKRWALNMEGRDSDRNSPRLIDGKRLGEWLVSTNVFPDLTLENHGFWDLPYQTGFAAMSEPIIAYHLCGKKIPEAFHANALEAGDHIFKWLVMPDGDLLCPQGIDWAERDVQHSWAFAVLGTLSNNPNPACGQSTANFKCESSTAHRARSSAMASTARCDETSLPRPVTYCKVARASTNHSSQATRRSRCESKVVPCTSANGLANSTSWCCYDASSAYACLGDIWGRTEGAEGLRTPRFCSVRVKRK